MDKLFGLDRPSAHDEDTAILTTTFDPVELSVIRSILEGENIPYRTRERGSGGMVSVIAGYSMFGTDILIPADLMETATELLEAYRNGADVESEEFAETEDAE